MARTISDEDIRLNIIVNGNPAQKQLLDLEKSTRKLTKETDALRVEKRKLEAQGKKNSTEWKALSATIKSNTATIDNNKATMKKLQSQIGITGLTMNQLKQRASVLRLALNNMVPGSADYIRYNKELSQISSRLTELKLKGRQTKLSLSGIANGFNKYAALGASAIAATTGVVLGMQKMIDYNGKLSDAQSDVQKTTGLTKKEVDELTKSFGILNTRTSRMDLLKIAEEGGRIGIAKEEIADFVRVMNKANVALGDSFEGGPEEVASKLGKLKLLFKETKDIGVDKAYESIGSAINELGANGVATETNIADFATRIGSLSDDLKPTIQDALGLGAAFEESGVMAEISGRAYSIFLGQAAKESSKFAKVMGITTEEVEKMINTNPTEFFLQFSQILSETSKGGTDTAKTMADLGLSADGVKKIVGAAGNNFERFRELLDLSNTSMIDASSLTNEYNIKNNNLAATIEKLQKKLFAAFSSPVIVNGLTDLVNWLGRVTGASKTLVQETEIERQELLKLEFKLKDVNTSAGERVKIIKKLQTDYPGYLDNLDAEKVTSEQITTAIKGINEQLINKIVLQKKDAEATKQAEKAGDLKLEKLDYEQKITEKLSKTKQRYNLEVVDGLTKEEQLLNFINQLQNDKAKNDVNAKSALIGLKNNLEQYRKIASDLNDEEALYNKLQEEKKQLAKDLGLNDTVVSGDENQPKEGDKKYEGKKLFIFQGGKWVYQKPTGGGGTGGAVETDEEIQIKASKKRIAEFIEEWENDQYIQKTLREEQLLSEEEAKDKAAIEMKYLKMAEQAGFDNAFQAGLEEVKQQEIDAVRQKYADKVLKDKKQKDAEYAKLDAEHKKKLIKADEDLEAAKQNVRNQGLSALQNVFGQQNIISKLAFGIQKAIAVQEILVNTKKANAQITANLAIANMKSIAASPLTGGMPMVAYNSAMATKSTLTNNINAGAQIAGIIASSIQGFEGGLYNKESFAVQRSQDGKMFNAQFGGQTSSGMVSKPTVFMAGENGPELIVDSQAFKQINPDIKNSFMREIGRVKGFEAGLYKPQTFTDVANNDVNLANNDTNVANTETIAVLNRASAILEKLERDGIIAYMSNDLKNAREIDKSIQDFKKLQNKNIR